LEYSDDNIIIDGDGLGRLPPPPLPPSPAVSSQCRSNTEQEEKECHRRSNDDIINREEGTDEGGSVGGDAEAVAAIVATMSNYYASNENGTPSNDDVRDIVPTAAVSARRRWKGQTTLSDCDARNAEGQSALSISSSNCFLGGVKLLIDSGADVNLRDAYMRTPLHLACESAAVHHHRHDCVEYLLMNGASLDVRDVRGRTPLHVAARGGCATCIRLLLDYGAAIASGDVGDAYGDTPLHVAARMGHLSCMEALSPGVRRRDGDSPSSAEPTSPSLLFDDRGSVVVDDLAGDPYYQSPRGASSRSPPRGTGLVPGATRRPGQDNGTTTYARDESPHDDIGDTPRFRNDSGYFTARGGSAWVKSKYYSDERHEDVRETSSIDSDTSSSVANDEYGCEDDSVSGGSDPCVAENVDVAVSTWIYGFILHIALYPLYLLSTWSNRVCKTSMKETLLRTSLAWSKPTDRTGTASTKMKPGDDRYQFVQPPKHVAEAMERLRSTRREKK